MVRIVDYLPPDDIPVAIDAGEISLAGHSGQRANDQQGIAVSRYRIKVIIAVVAVTPAPDELPVRRPFLQQAAIVSVSAAATINETIGMQHGIRDSFVTYAAPGSRNLDCTIGGP